MTAALFALTPLVSTAEDREIPEPHPMMVGKGLLCDTEEEVQVALTAISLGEDDFPEGCGRFVPRSPIPMVASPLYWYETADAFILVAHFLHPETMWEQYGWVDVELKPAASPRPTGQKL